MAGVQREIVEHEGRHHGIVRQVETPTMMISSSYPNLLSGLWRPSWLRHMLHLRLSEPSAALCSNSLQIYEAISACMQGYARCCPVTRVRAGSWCCGQMVAIASCWTCRRGAGGCSLLTGCAAFLMSSTVIIYCVLGIWKPEYAGGGDVRVRASGAGSTGRLQCLHCRIWADGQRQEPHHAGYGREVMSCLVLLHACRR